MNVNVCLDNERFYNKKSASKAIKTISNRIAGYEVEIPLRNLVYEVGQCGRSFTPAVFKENRRVSDFKGMQVFCLDFDKGELTVDVSYDEYNAEEKDRIRKILDAIGAEYAEELADEMINELIDDEWADFYDGDVQEAFFDAAIAYAEDSDDFISQMIEKAHELFDIVIDDDDDV